jgi:hypothetical protein
MSPVSFCSSYHRYQYLKLRGHQESTRQTASAEPSLENASEAQTQ